MLFLSLGLRIDCKTWFISFYAQTSSWWTRLNGRHNGLVIPLIDLKNCLIRDFGKAAKERNKPHSILQSFSPDSGKYCGHTVSLNNNLVHISFESLEAFRKTKRPKELNDPHRGAFFKLELPIQKIPILLKFHACIFDVLLTDRISGCLQGPCRL